jgi:hypothetical protein
MFQVASKMESKLLLSASGIVALLYSHQSNTVESCSERGHGQQ